MNIQEQVQSALNNIVSSGTIEEIISKKVEKTIEDILNDSLRSYSDFGKKLEEVIKQSLQIDLSKISTLGYQQIVVDIVKQKLQEATLNHIAEPIEKALNEVIAPFEKRTYKLSEIIQKYKEHEWDSSDDDEVEISFHVEYGRYGSVYIGFDKEENKERYSCAYQLSINKEDNVLWLFEIKGWKPQRGDLRAQSIHGSFDHFIFNLYASQCPIEIDESNVETYWSRYDY